MKEVKLVFLEKSELQILGIPKLLPVLGISSMWESQNDIFQQIQFQNKIVFSGPGETGIVKKNWYQKTWKFFSYWHL